MAWIPLSRVTDLETLTKRLTVEVSRPTDAAYGDWEEFVDPNTDDRYEDISVRCYSLARPGYIGVPRVFAMKEFKHLRFLRAYVHGEARPDLVPQTIEARNATQERFFRDIEALSAGADSADAFVLAPTGVGKTAGALRAIQADGIPTLIVVHTNRLKDQWLGSTVLRQGMRYFWGAEWVEHNVGIAQQNVCDFRDKLVVVGLAPSLVRRVYPRDFYRHFGRIIFDEVDVLATPSLMRIMGMFPARIRIGMSATRRRDNLQKIISLFLGAAKVTTTLHTRTPTVYVHEFHATDTRLNEHSEGAMINSLVRLPERNRRLAELVVRKYEAGRNIVVMSDRINHLQGLQRYLLDRANIPENHVGLFVGKYWTGEYRVTVSWKEDGRNRRYVAPRTFVRRHQANLHAAEYVVQHDLAGQCKVNVYKDMYQPTEDEYNHMKRTCRILLATYQIFGRGLDAPHLDCGIEGTPRGDIRQAMGRIGRDPNNPRVPEWHSINDIICPPKPTMFAPDPKPYALFLDKAKARVLSYQHHKARVVHVAARREDAA